MDGWNGYIRTRVDDRRRPAWSISFLAFSYYNNRGRRRKRRRQCCSTGYTLVVAYIKDSPGCSFVSLFYFFDSSSLDSHYLFFFSYFKTKKEVFFFFLFCFISPNGCLDSWSLFCFDSPPPFFPLHHIFTLPYCPIRTRRNPPLTSVGVFFFSPLLRVYPVWSLWWLGGKWVRSSSSSS